MAQQMPDIIPSRVSNKTLYLFLILSISFPTKFQRLHNQQKFITLLFMIYLEDEFSGGEMISARPRRMSELNNAPTQIMPIPPASSFFIFSETNRFETNDTNKQLSEFNKNAPPHPT